MGGPRSTLPFDPRRSLLPEHSTVGRLGRVVLDRVARFRSMVATLGAAAAVIVLIIKDSEGEQRLPLPGGPDDVRIP